ncbi:MAG: lasso peptide biosynthesis B2 protein [Acidimicrobiia bacterium]|nr:lasso peptide biosynthesis B2 protein [Acidimicrobiia bacterium]
MGSVSAAFNRLRRMNWSQRRALLFALVALPLATLSLRVLGLKRTMGVVPPTRSGKSLGSSEDQFNDARRLAYLVGLAARRGIGRPNCLSRSVVLWSLLRRRGLAGEIRLGVRGGNGTTPLFHAWVEYDGAVINDVPDVAERYSPFAGTIEPGRDRLE